MDRSIDEIVEGARVRLAKKIKRPYVATSLSTLEIQAVLQNRVVETESGSVFLPAHHFPGYVSLLEEKGSDIKLNRVGSTELPFLFHVGYGVEGVEYNSGPMGASAPVAVTKAVSTPDKKAYVLLGNAEMREGRTYESLAFAASQEIENLVVMVNDNGKSLDGDTSLDYNGVLQGFGFETEEVNGHDLDSVQAAVDRASASKKRYGIVFKTERNHGIETNDIFYDGRTNSGGSAKTLGKVIAKLGGKYDFTVVAADTAASTGLDGIQEVNESRLVNVGCSEQLLLGGLETYQFQGTSVVAGTFAKFLLETGREQVEHLIANYREGVVKTSTVLVATHNGLSSGINGRSHHCLTAYEFIGRDDVNLYHAAGETQLSAMMEDALKRPEITIILTEREDPQYADDIWGGIDYQFERGTPEELTEFGSDNYTLIIANGSRAYDAIAAAEDVKGVEVLSIPSFPLDETKLAPYLQRAKKVIVVEESNKPYLGDQVELIGHRSGSRAEYEPLTVTDPGFGLYKDLVRTNGLDTKGVAERL
jgi:transketolase C-terminal domain/subunit/transketolase N-terminal domain/subunit